MWFQISSYSFSSKFFPLTPEFQKVFHFSPLEMNVVGSALSQGIRSSEISSGAIESFKCRLSSSMCLPLWWAPLGLVCMSSIIASQGFGQSLCSDFRSQSFWSSLTSKSHSLNFPAALIIWTPLFATWSWQGCDFLSPDLGLEFGIRLGKKAILSQFSSKAPAIY